jgi:hypothetical protein
MGYVGESQFMPICKPGFFINKQGLKLKLPNYF